MNIKSFTDIKIYADGINEEGVKICQDAIKNQKLKVLSGFDENMEPIEAIYNPTIVNDLEWQGFKVTASDNETNLLFVDAGDDKVYIKGVEFDEILTRLHRLEQKGFWAWIKRIWRS